MIIWVSQIISQTGPIGGELTIHLVMYHSVLGLRQVAAKSSTQLPQTTAKSILS
jgi:hypothetical protein